MGIKNLTETEEKEFYRLVGKMNGEEPDKKQDAKVKKPQINECYYIVDNDGTITSCVWLDNNFDRRRWKLGNVFLTKQEAEFAREKRRIEVELGRYAKEHNGTAFNNRCYLIRCEEDEKRLLCDTWATAKIQGTVMFTSRDVLADAIETIGRKRILKYIFGVESEGEE